MQILSPYLADKSAVEGEVQWGVLGVRTSPGQ